MSDQTYGLRLLLRFGNKSRRPEGADVLSAQGVALVVLDKSELILGD
jgi:hypothetical protein